MTTLSDFTPDRCAKLAEDLGFRISHVSDNRSLVIRLVVLEEIKPIENFSHVATDFIPTKDIEFNPTNAEAYFLLEDAISKIKEVGEIKYTTYCWESISYTACIALRLNDQYIFIRKEAETKILALFLAAEELMDRVKRECDSRRVQDV